MARTSPGSKRPLFALLATAALVVATWVVCQHMCGDQPPDWVVWQDATLDIECKGTADSGVEGAEGPAEDRRSSHGKAVLAKRELVAYDEDDRQIARTPAEWLVQQACAADIDGDERQELVLLVWKRGSFGTKHPFWMENDDEWSQHVFVVRVPKEPGEFERVWMSSALGNEVASASLDDEARLILVDRKDRTTCWAWDSFGFVLQ